MAETTLETPVSEKEQTKAAKAEQKLAAAELKAQEKLAKAEQKAQEKLAKAEEKARKKAEKAEKAARKGKGEEEPEPVQESQPIVVRPRLELVLEPGPVKHVHWDADRSAPTPDQEDEEEPAPTPLPDLPDLARLARPAPVQSFRNVAPVEAGTDTLDAWEPTSTRAPAPRAAASRKAPARRRAPRKPTRIYPGDNHPVIDIEGIGPVYAKKLEKLGITTTGLLNVAKPGRIANKIGVPRRTVKMWQAECELIKVRGIGPQFAEAMARAGIKGIDELKQRKPDDVARQVAKYLRKLDTTVVGQPVTAKRVALWKRRARPMRRIKVDKKALAIPTHGLPPPWLREGAKAKKAGRKTAKDSSRKAATKGRKTARKANRPARRAK